MLLESASNQLSKYFLSCLLSVVFTHGLNASNNNNQVIRVYTSESSFADTSDHSDYYKDLLSLIMPPEAVAYELQITPHMRSAHLFYADPGSCRLPSNLRTLSKYFGRPVPLKYIESRAFSYNQVVVFSAPGTIPPATPEDMVGKRIAAPTGSLYLKRFEALDLTVVHTKMDVQRTDILMAGRVDLMLASIPSVRTVFKKLKGPWPVYDAALVLENYTLHLACHATPQTRKLVDIVDKHIVAAENNGELQKLYERHNLSIPAMNKK